METRLVSHILLILTSILLNSSCTLAQRSNYGEPCNDTTLCDRRSWLSCHSDRCDCLKPSTMLYEPSSKTCIVRAGEVCKFFLGDSGNKNLVYEVSCVQNSSCSPTGFCTCDPKFYELSNGTCHPGGTYQQPCDDLQKCSDYDSLICTSNSICQCDPVKSTYKVDPDDPSKSQCVGLAGQTCIHTQCVEGATCDSSGTCKCDESFRNNGEGSCVPKMSINGKCRDDSYCSMFKDTQLTCVNGTCQCDPRTSRYGTGKKHYHPHSSYGDHYHFRGFHDSTEHTQCLGLAGSPCQNRLCVPGAYCSFQSQESIGTCNCQPVYTKSDSGSCGLAYGQGCTVAETCLGSLVCKFQTCSCPSDDQSYNSTDKLCKSLVGGPCQKAQDCGTNAKCVFTSAQDRSGHCACEEGFVENTYRTCEIAFGSKCSIYSKSSAQDRSKYCDSVASLYCIDEICQCGRFTKYDEKLRKCVGLVGAKCELHDTESCVGNAHCQRFHRLLPGRCVCNEGAVETDEYTCDAPVEEKVNGDEEKRMALYDILAGVKITTTTTPSALAPSSG